MSNRGIAELRQALVEIKSEATKIMKQKDKEVEGVKALNRQLVKLSNDRDDILADIEKILR